MRNFKVHSRIFVLRLVSGATGPFELCKSIETIRWVREVTHGSCALGPLRTKCSGLKRCLAPTWNYVAVSGVGRLSALFTFPTSVFCDDVLMRDTASVTGVALYLRGSRWNTTSSPGNVRRCLCALGATSSLQPQIFTWASRRPRNFANQPRKEAHSSATHGCRTEPIFACSSFSSVACSCHSEIVPSRTCCFSRCVALRPLDVDELWPDFDSLPDPSPGAR